MRDPRIDVVIRTGQGGQNDLQSNIQFGNVKSYIRQPFNAYPPALPSNYLDFMKLYYTTLDNDQIDENPYFTHRLNYRKLSDLASGKKGNTDYLIARWGLKYYTFFKMNSNLNKESLINDKRNPVKAYIKSASKIEEVFYELKNKLEVSDTSLGNLLINTQNEVVQTLLLESLKMEDIMNDSMNKSSLGLGYNHYCGCDRPTTLPEHGHDHHHHPCDDNTFFGDQKALYVNLVDLLHKINYNLTYPKLAEGMVSRKELELELEKIIPGVPRDELAAILLKYPTLDNLDVKLTNFVTKAENQALLSGYVMKTDAVNYVTVDFLTNYYTKAEVDTALDKYMLKSDYRPTSSYSQTEIDAMFANYYTSDIIDLKISNLVDKTLVTREYLAETNYTKEEIENLLLEYQKAEEMGNIFYDKNDIDSKFTSLSDVYLSKEEADEKFLAKADIPSLGDITIDKVSSKTYVDNKVSIATQEVRAEADRKYATIPQVENTFKEYVTLTEYQAMKNSLEQRIVALETEIAAIKKHLSL